MTTGAGPTSERRVSASAGRRPIAPRISPRIARRTSDWHAGNWQGYEGESPDWHGCAGCMAWLFVDEALVNP